MSTGRINRIIEVVLLMEVGSTLPISDPAAIALLHKANNSKTLEQCLTITNTHIKKQFEPKLVKLLAPLLR
jgi:hypothetical protein